jgi:hypothetical protein
LDLLSISIADLKRAIGSKLPVRTKPKLDAAAIDPTPRIEADPDRVTSCFRDPRVEYAARKHDRTGSTTGMARFTMARWPWRLPHDSCATHPTAPPRS